MAKRSPTEKMFRRVLKVLKGQPLPQVKEVLTSALGVCIVDMDNPAAEAERMAEWFAKGAERLRADAAYEARLRSGGLQ